MVNSNVIRILSNYRYDATSGQHVILTVVLAALLFSFYSLLQMLMGVVAHVFIFKSAPNFADANLMQQSDFLKSVVIGIFPSAVIAAVVTWLATKIRNKSKQNGLPLHSPQLGFVGWVLLLAGFIFSMFLVFTVTFWVLDIDPATYMPTRDGIGDTNSAAGMIEKILADMTDEPVLFALAVPSIAIAGPVLEELIFRGAVFAALRQTSLGTLGAMVLTSAVWAVVHGSTAPWLFVGLLFVMGMVLSWLLLRFGSLWVPIVCHCVWNGMVTFSFLSAMGLQ
jgi:uncharacterized protein